MKEFLKGLSHLTPIELSELLYVPAFVVGIFSSITSEPCGSCFTTPTTSKAFGSMFTIPSTLPFSKYLPHFNFAPKPFSEVVIDPYNFLSHISNLVHF